MRQQASELRKKSTVERDGICRRAAELVSRMTLEEKVSQMSYRSEAIPRLGIPAYNWWNECLHGVARAGVATVFPQAIGLAATFDTRLVGEVASAIADEARAKHHESVRMGDLRIYKGLTFWTPNVNIFRDPRWGRGQETYGEDPYLTGRMGVVFVRGLQGDDPEYLKLIATPKHFAAHSGPEALRHQFDAVVSAKDLRETYLPAFKECVVEGRAASIMGAYSRLNGDPCCASPTLLGNILREEWGFDGYVVSDCGAIGDIHLHHKVTASAPESAALAVGSGCDLCCGYDYAALKEAVAEGLISEEAVDRSVRRLMEARIRLGMFDEPERVPYASIPTEVVDSQEHRDLALEAARTSLVLLKNSLHVLPLLHDLRSIAVIGPNADSRRVLLGNYNGLPSRSVTVLDGIRALAAARTVVRYAPGCELVSPPADEWGRLDDDGFAEARATAERSDVVVLCLGISGTIEGEEGDTLHSESQGDRVEIGLPDVQERLLEAVAAVGKPIVLVLLSGSPVAIPWAQEHADAILAAWYPGEEGGTAIAEVLFGAYNPAGRLPVTFVRSLEHLPPFTDYRMAGRTYRYLTEEPLYPFGYGLSYTTFTYRNLSITGSVAAGERPADASANARGTDTSSTSRSSVSGTGRSRSPAARGSDCFTTASPAARGAVTIARGAITVAAEVENAGGRAGEEVVQLYVSDLEASVEVPRFSLRGFQRLRLEPGERRTVTFELTPRQLALIDEAGRCILEPGAFRVYLGGSQPDPRSVALTGSAPLSADFEVAGVAVELEY